MELIEKLTNELDVEMTRVWEEYVDLHKELDTHRGKTMDDTEMVEVNKILEGIQNKFALLHPAYHFIASRHQFVSNAANSYNEFIEMLIKGGAKQSDPNDAQKIIVPGSSGVVNEG